MTTMIFRALRRIRQARIASTGDHVDVCHQY
jgi:hypothetical protein